MATDYFFLVRAIDPQRLKSALNCPDMPSGAVFAATVVTGCDPCALAVAIEALKYAGRTRVTLLCDQGSAVKKRADNVQDSRAREAALLNASRGRAPAREASIGRTTRSRSSSGRSGRVSSSATT